MPALGGTSSGLGAVFRWVRDLWLAMGAGGGAVHGAMGCGTGGIGGNVYYVDGINGLDTNQGTRTHPWQTIRHALDQCVNDHDDYILVKDCWQQEATWPITVDVTRVHIIGIANPTGQYPKMQPTTDNPVFLVTAAGQYSEIAGFDLGGLAASTHACIELDNAISTWVHCCVFGSIGAGGAPQDGVRFIAGNARQVLIEDCFFYGTAANGMLTQHGIHVAGGAGHYHSVFRRNTFNGVPGSAIYVTAGGAAITIRDNVIACDADTQGAAITLEPTAANCLVCDNRAQFGEAAMGQNPYLDQALANSNHWTYNWSGNALVYPA